MKFSIITVCKNAEKAIERTMLSVVTQTYQNIEYIIVDGASTDKTLEIVKQYSEKHSNIKWMSETDSGIYQAMNKGIKMATGDIIAFLNAGDYLIHYNVIALVSETIKDEECDVVHGNCINVHPFSGEYSINKGTVDYCPEFFYNNAMPHQAIFYKKDILIKFGLYDEKFKIISDNLLNKKIFCDKTVSKKYIDQIISVYFWDGISSQEDGHFGSIHNKERDIFHKEGFNEVELVGVFDFNDRKEKIRIRKNKKSVLRFLSKLFEKSYEYWINK